METSKEYYYTYYSYEEWGRGYIGSRGCNCLPEEDVKYFGSFKDKTFKPTQKIILKDDYATREEAYADEIILHDYYDVANNPHFANRSRQTSTKFKCPIVNNPSAYLTKEQLSENGKKGIQSQRERGVGIWAFTPEQKSNVLKKASKIGGAIMGKRHKENGTGIFSLSKEEKLKVCSMGGKAINSQKWMCLETGYITSPGPLTSYQRARGIDTSKRKRIE